jgi:hypothetical protein
MRFRFEHRRDVGRKISSAGGRNIVDVRARIGNARQALQNPIARFFWRAWTWTVLDASDG